MSHHHVAQCLLACLPTTKAQNYGAALQASVVVLNTIVGPLHEGGLCAALLGLLLEGGQDQAPPPSAAADSNGGPASSSGGTVYVAAAVHLQHGKDAGRRLPGLSQAVCVRGWGKRLQANSTAQRTLPAVNCFDSYHAAVCCAVLGGLWHGCCKCCLPRSL